MANYTALAGADSFTGNGSAADTISIANGTVSAGDVFNAGNGSDDIVLTTVTGTTVNFTGATVTSVETLTGSAGGDSVTMTADQFNNNFATINLGGGTDALNLDISAGQSLTVAGKTLTSVENVNLTVASNWATDFALVGSFLTAGVTSVNWSKNGFNYSATAAGGGNITVLLSDVGNQRSYTSVSTTYTAAGVPLSGTVTYDDGRLATDTYTAGVLTTSVLTDPNNVHTFLNVTTTYSNAGVLQGRVTNYDNGSRLTQTYLPDGSRTDYIEDLTNVYNYVTRSTSYNAAGQPTSQTVVLDNGNTQVFSYVNGLPSTTVTTDTNNNEAFNTLTSYYTAGVIDRTETINDNGTMTIIGGAGANVLTGGAFNDAINGGGGQDRLIGGGGIDTLVGGANADAFVLQETFAGRDNILDFSMAQGDTFELSRTAFGDFDNGGAVAASDWFQSNETGLAEDASDRFIYNSKTGQLFFDADGQGGNAGVLVATLTTKPAIADGDTGIFNVVA